MSIMKNTPYVSIVAILVCTKCMKSKAKTAVVQAGTAMPPNIFLHIAYNGGSMSMPKSIPENLHPKGVTPNRSMPIDIIIFPSGGCEISYMFSPLSPSRAVLAW